MPISEILVVHVTYDKEIAMNRRPAFLFLTLAAFAVLAVTSSARGAGRSGQELFKDTCKSCHLPDSPNGEYTPMSLIQDQWREFFAEQWVPAHENLTDPAHDGRKVLELLAPEEFELLRDWTIEHAADSENPMTCG